MQSSRCGGLLIKTLPAAGGETRGGERSSMKKSYRRINEGRIGGS